jgi:hypothetical protein
MSMPQSIKDSIAREILGIDSLETQNCDELDFHDVAVWTLDKALEASFQAGRDYSDCEKRKG